MRARASAIAVAALIVALTAGVAFAGVVAAGVQRVVTPARASAVASPTPSPAALSAAARLGRPLPPLPPMPKSSAHVRRIQSATGACIVFAFNANCASAGDANENFVAGASIAWHAANLPATGQHEDYVLTPANAGAPVAVTGTPYTGATGPNETQTNAVAGIYVFASLNKTTNQWDAISYVLVGGAVSIETYTDGTLTTKTQTYTTNTSGTGVTVFIAAQGLNAQDKYAVGVEDQLTGYCVFTAPSSAQTATPSSLCQLSTATLTGTTPTGSGLLLANWGVTLGSGTTPPQGGTYVATVYDQTIGQRVASRLFTVIDGRATASTARVNLQFKNGGGSTTGASVTRIAYNGTATSVNDPGQTYMQLEFGASGLPANDADTLKLVVTDPTGDVAQTFSTTEGYGTTTITPGNNDWNLPTQTIPFEQAYPGSTWTATIYDSTTSKLIAEQSFQVLGYSASVLWESPGSASINIASGNSISTSLQYTNNADSVYGANNGDPLTAFKTTTVGSGGQKFSSVTLQPPGAQTACTPTTTVPCTGTYADSAGNTWTTTLTTTGGANPDFTITSVPVNASTALAVNSSLEITGLTFTSTTCGTAPSCLLYTSLTAQDMLPGYTSSIGSNVGFINPVVITEGTGGVSATSTVTLAGYYDSAATWHASQDAGYTPRFNHALTTANNPFTGAASDVDIAYTIKNTSTYAIAIFDILLPSELSVTATTLDTAHSPNNATLTTNGYCDGQPVSNTICVTPSTAIAAGATQTFYLKTTPPSTSFSYTDLVGTIIQSAYDGYNIYPQPITPASASVATFIGNPTTTDSAALASYSLNGGLMAGGITPGTIGTNTGAVLQFNLRNTPTSSDALPDEVDFVAFQVPSNTYVTVPTSCNTITVQTSGWSCLAVTSGSGQPTTFYFGQCPQQAPPVPTLPASSTTFGSDNLTICPFALPNEPYSLAAGGVLNVSVPVTAGATPTGTPIQISTWAHGATTDGWTTPILSSLSVTPSAAAGTGFFSITSPTGSGQLPVQQGSQPQITGNYNGTANTYVYKIYNTGAVAITSAVIAIPGPDTTGTNGADASGNIWKLSAAPTLIDERTGNANGCTDTYQNPTSGLDTTGKITITCPSGAFISSDTLDVTFTAVAPLKINSTYSFAATINGSATAASPEWYNDNTILVALAAYLSVSVNPLANYIATDCTGTGAGAAISTTLQTINFGQLSSGQTGVCKDALVATLQTDAADPVTWSLYISASGNPPRTGGGATNELLYETDSASSTAASSVPCAGGTPSPCFFYDNTAAYTPMGLTSSGTGTRVGYTGTSGTGVNNGSITFYSNLEVSIGTETVPQVGYQETITYTWIGN